MKRELTVIAAGISISMLGIVTLSEAQTIEEIQPGDWAEKVFKPDILNNREKLYKKPGCNPFN